MNLDYNNEDLVKAIEQESYLNTPTQKEISTKLSVFFFNSKLKEKDITKFVW